MIKTLFITDNLAPISGVSMVIKNLIDYSDRSVVEFTIAVQKNQRNDFSFFERRGIKLVVIPDLSLFTIKSFVAFFEIFFEKNNFDIIHSHFPQIDNIIFPIAKKNGKTKCISHSHSSRLSDKWWKALRNKLLCYNLAKRADVCAACSEQAGIALYGNRFPKLNKRLIIKNGIDCSKYLFDASTRTQLRQEYQIQSDCIVIGHVGRFSLGKNQIFIVKILKELRRRGKNFKLFLIGVGEMMVSVKQEVDNLGLNEFVIFAGGKNNVSHYLNLFDVFVMPSIHEGLGISAIEAQANGLECVLSSAIPAEVNLTDVTFLSLNDSITKWADVLEILPKVHHNDYNKMVIEAGYDIHAVGKEMTQLYKKMVDNEYN
jgi:glycosyltransferase involved in cell wall biosynthesis